MVDKMSSGVFTHRFWQNKGIAYKRMSNERQPTVPNFPTVVPNGLLMGLAQNIQCEQQQMLSNCVPGRCFGIPRGTGPTGRALPQARGQARR